MSIVVLLDLSAIRIKRDVLLTLYALKENKLIAQSSRTLDMIYPGQLNECQSYSSIKIEDSFQLIINGLLTS